MNPTPTPAEAQRLQQIADTQAYYAMRRYQESRSDADLELWREARLAQERVARTLSAHEHPGSQDLRDRYPRKGVITDPT